MMKFNLAFVPTSDLKPYFVLVSDKEKHAKNYCLGQHSIPHVTICQFYSELEKLDNIVREICLLLVNTDLELTFQKYSNVTFDDNVYWLSLIPDETRELQAIFDRIGTIVTPIRKDKYDPHLTLFNYARKDLVLEQEIEKNRVFIKGYFDLIIGQCDEVGQLTNIIKFVSKYKAQVGVKHCLEKE